MLNAGNKTKEQADGFSIMKNLQTASNLKDTSKKNSLLKVIILRLNELDSDFNKSFLDNSLTATLQWKNIDMGWLDTNEQRITTFRDQSFYTTTNYIYEVDMITLNLSYVFQNGKNRSKFIESEFGKREF